MLCGLLFSLRHLRHVRRVPRVNVAHGRVSDEIGLGSTGHCSHSKKVFSCIVEIVVEWKWEARATDSRDERVSELCEGEALDRSTSYGKDLERALFRNRSNTNFNIITGFAPCAVSNFHDLRNRPRRLSFNHWISHGGLNPVRLCKKNPFHYGYVQVVY